MTSVGGVWLANPGYWIVVRGGAMEPWPRENNGRIKIGVFTGNRLAAVLIVPFALVPLAASAGFGALLAFGVASSVPLTFVEVLKMLLLILPLGSVGAFVAFLIARLMFGTSAVYLDLERVVVTSGVGPLRWTKSFPRSSWTSVEIVSRTRWYGLELRGERKIRVGSGGKARAEQMLQQLRPELLRTNRAEP